MTEGTAGLVVFATTELAPDLPGGAGVVVAELADRLAREGRPVAVVLVTEPQGLPPGVRTRPSGARVITVAPLAPDDAAPTPFLARSRAAARAVADLVAREPLDRVEVADFDGLGFVLLARRAELGLDRTPLLVRVHGPVDLMSEAMAASAPDWGPVVVMEREAFRMADGVLVPSAPVGELARARYGLEPERVVVAEPPVVPLLPAERAPAAAPEFACLGRLGEVKGSHDLVDAAIPVLREHPRAVVRFLGADGWSATADRPMRAWLSERIPRELAGRIRFEEPVPRADLARALATAWAVVVPSRFESFCLAAHEARGAGFPLVVADLPAFRPYFRPGTGALVYDRTVVGLSAALRELAGDPALRETLAVAPPPAYGDALAAYRRPAPPPRHARSQAGLATAALQHLDAALPRPPRKGPARIARAGLRLVPRPAARAAVRLLPARAKNRFRRLASWPEEVARRDAASRQAGLARRIAAGEFPDLAEPAVSVVVPCFEQGRFLPDALASVFEQTFASWEVVVVDDGSTEPATVAAIDRLDLPRTTVVRQANRGLPGARNAGIGRARGRFVVPLDADDELAPTFLEELVGALEREPAAAFAHCWAELYGDVEAIWVSRPYNPYQLLLSNSVIGCVVLRRAAWDEVGGYGEDMREGNEDWDLWLRLLDAGHGQVEVRRPLFRYRKHGVSMSVETEARFERARERMRSRHPRLYAPEHVRELKASCYPLVSVVARPDDGLGELARQRLDDLEVVAAGGASARLGTLCAARGWPLRDAPAELAAAIHASRGKYVAVLGALRELDPDGLARLADALEDAPHAPAARGAASVGAALWRRWAVVDPRSPHGEPVAAPAVARADPHDLRGAFPQPGWAVHLDLGEVALPVQRQPPEEEGRLPAWAARPAA